MSDPLRAAGSRAPDADRDGKIEQLRLAGLDRYVAARFEQAINIWTRPLLQTGVAIERGDGSEARADRHLP